MSLTLENRFEELGFVFDILSIEYGCAKMRELAEAHNKADAEAARLNQQVILHTPRSNEWNDLAHEFTKVDQKAFQLHKQYESLKTVWEASQEPESTKV